MERLEIPQAEMVTLLATLVTAMLINIEEQLPSHSRYGRQVRKTEGALIDLAKLVGKPLSDELVNIGVNAWNAAIKQIQDDLGRMGYGN